MPVCTYSGDCGKRIQGQCGLVIPVPKKGREKESKKNKLYPYWEAVPLLFGGSPGRAH